MANHKSGAERYNDRMAKTWEDAKRLERERLKRGEEPNFNLTSPEEAQKYQDLRDAVTNAEETLADAMDDTSALDRGEIIELREELARARKALEAA
jgi:hypothetical protein